MRPNLGGGIAERLQPTVDRLRARYTTFGLRPYRVFMVWTRWSGSERGEGNERLVGSVEIVPRPKVDDLTRVSLSPFSAGILPVGSLAISQVSALLTADNLKGLAVPGQAMVTACKALPGMPPGGTPIGEVGLTALERALGEAQGLGRIPEPYDFYYEVVEDRAGSERPKFRPFSEPFRDAGKMEWRIVLERVSEDRARDGHMRFEEEH